MCGICLNVKLVVLDPTEKDKSGEMLREVRASRPRLTRRESVRGDKARR